MEEDTRKQIDDLIQKVLQLKEWHEENFSKQLDILFNARKNGDTDLIGLLGIQSWFHQSCVEMLHRRFEVIMDPNKNIEELNKVATLYPDELMVYYYPVIKERWESIRNKK